MIKLLIQLGKMLLMLAPFLLLVLRDSKANLKRKDRSKQFLMPIFALVYTLVVMCLLAKVYDLATLILGKLPQLLERFALWVSGKLAGGSLEKLGVLLKQLADHVTSLLRHLNLAFWAFYLANALVMLVHVILKRIVLLFLKGLCKPDNGFYNLVSGLFYDLDEETGNRYVKRHFGQARTFLKTFFIASVVFAAVGVLISSKLYLNGWLTAPFYPVFGVILIGELYFFLNGLTQKELRKELTGEEEESEKNSDYSMMRKVLRKLFPDKLGAENTTICDDTGSDSGDDGLLEALEDSDQVREEAYGRFMRAKAQSGMELDRNYLLSGKQLLNGESVLFNNPFYYDLIPYIFYPMNRCLLRHKKVLVILGRHGVEENIEAWCRDGLTAVTNVPSLWNIGLLTDSPQDLDVGIVTRSSVHDLKLHEMNRDFFDETEFVVLLEPSRLVTTAQVGLNSLVRHCRRKEKQLVFCSADKNCDGLVDSLSHILMTSLREVSATNHHRGASSYMCWDGTSQRLQHRMLPNLSRYLGMGTELSFAALKNQVEETDWYGGEAFPVVDIHWIVKQYYYDLLRYANLPATQETMDRCFKVSHDLWSARAGKNRYLTVEDESFNMFEVKRDFSTRATEQGFINVISSQYLLKDYMAANDGIFNADPKAIPYITADYARTARNVALRLCLRMSTGLVPERDICRELMMIDRDVTDPAKSLWHEICLTCRNLGSAQTDRDGRETLCCHTAHGDVCFHAEVLQLKRRFSMDTGVMENMYRITDGRFIQILLGSLRPAEYIAEDENGSRQYLGTELQGQVFQKYLPGQFFTFGGKYYEMLRVTSEGQVLVRRAADHIEGRPSYRQVRRYYLSGAVDSTTMGECRDMGAMRLTRQFADIRVETPAYWKLDQYNDFATGRRVGINGVPERVYNNKPILRIDLNPGELPTPQVMQTLTLLMNEVLRTLLAENQDYLVAVTPGEVQEPLTYSLEGENGFTPEANSIYILEDSQLDIGLLDAVERNLNRIFAILCDYLQWHQEAMDLSLNPPPEPEPPVFTVDPEEAGQQEKEPKTWFGRLLRKIRNFFKKIFSAIGNFFRKLFRRKPKDQEPRDEEPQDAEPQETEPQETEPQETEPQETEPQETEPQETEPQEPENEEPLQSMTLGSFFRPEKHRDIAPEDTHVQTADGQEGDRVEFEPEQTLKPGSTMERQPYHERYFLRYGSEEYANRLDLPGVKALLEDLGYGNGSLRQAREGKDAAEMVERSFVPNRAGSHYCDFCGCELVGTEYEVLSDGRERCMACGRTAVKSLEEFVSIHDTVLRNMKAFYGIRITAPVRVQMVNSKKLHKKLGKTFIPTGKFDGRVLGVAIKDREGYSILVENGAPRLQSTMTMVHEMTHIWQYLNWDAKGILNAYGKAQNLEVYEGMAKWVEIQYAYLLGEAAAAKREEMITRVRQDEYGRGFLKYAEKYPLSTGPSNGKPTPFDNPKAPL